MIVREGFWLNVSLVFAGLSFLTGLFGLVRGRERTVLSRWLMAVSGTALLGAWIIRWRSAGHIPLANQYESMVFLALGTAWAAVFAGKGRSWVSMLAGIGVAILLGLAAFLHAPVEPLVPALQSNWLLIHVIIVMLSYAAFVLAAISSAWLLIRKGKKGKGAPSDADLDGFSYRTIGAGFLLLAVGIGTGAVWANEAWGTWWSWDPKETWALITWIAYAVALHLRRSRGWRMRRFAWLCLAGLACVAFTYFGVNYLLSGLHSYAR